MNALYYFPLACLLSCSACGRSLPQQVSAKDSAQVELYRLKSIRFQAKAPDSAVWYADRGLKLARQLRYQRGEVLLLERMAALNAQYGNVALAVRYQQESVRLSGTASARSELGILLARNGDRAGGRRLILATLKQYEQQNDVRGKILSYTRLGEISELAGDSRNALHYYQKAENLQSDRPVTDEYFDLLNTIGQLHTRSGDHDEAARYFGTAARKSNTHHKVHVRSLNLAGKAWAAHGDTSKALAFHREALEKARQHNLPEEEARSLIGMAGAIKNDDAVQSIQHLKNALAIAKSIGHKELSAEIYQSLSDIYHQQHRYQEAMSTLSAHHRLLDSLLRANEQHRIAVLQGSYELAESKLKIETLELLAERRAHQRNELALAAAAITVIALILAYHYRRTSKLNRALTASNQIKDKLFSIIGHDLRNPIGGITQLLAVMEEGGLSEAEAQELITEMRKQGNVTLEILNALLNWGEAQLKGVHVKATAFQAQDSIRKNILALQQQAADKGIIVNAEVSPDLHLYGDQDHFEFIIRNLLSNALKFSRTGEEVEIWTELKAEDRQVVFAIRDHGKGIGPAQQEQFRKADMEITYGTKGEKGTGIGLMLSKEFVTANQGRIWLESEVGKGATFYFTFRLAS